jgi:hypothetical protein
MVVGAGVALLFRRGPSGARPVIPALRGAGAGLMWAGRRAAKYGAKGARWTADRGEDLWDALPRDRIERSVRDHLGSAREAIGDHLGSAREAIDDVVESELRDLQKAIRRRRKQLGL